MTFAGTALDDVNKILAAFPRRFTIKEVERYFEWPAKRVKQAIIMGQQTDAITVLFQAKNEIGVSGEATYENVTWRKEWLTRAWRASDGSIMASSGQEHG
jgi:hypothetical protein